MRRFSGGVKCLGEIRIDGGVAVRVVLPARTSASIINPGPNVARLSSVKQAGSTDVIKSIVTDVLVVRIGSLSSRAQTSCTPISAGFLQTPRVIILVSALEPIVS